MQTIDTLCIQIKLQSKNMIYMKKKKYVDEILIINVHKCFFDPIEET